jgi:hypothetical protein
MRLDLDMFLSDLRASSSLDTQCDHIVFLFTYDIMVVCIYVVVLYFGHSLKRPVHEKKVPTTLISLVMDLPT